MVAHRSAIPLRVLGTLGLVATLGAWLPAQAALTLSAVGSYTLGANTGAPGTSASATTSCGSTGQDALEFTGSGANNVGIHSYSCDFGGFISFGSRASGEGTYYVDATASVAGKITASGGSGLSFFVSGGQVGAFGSTSFTAGEYQQSSLSILLDIDGVTYLNDSWATEVGAGGAITSSGLSSGTMSVGFSGPTTGAGFVSYGINSQSIFINIADGTYDINYVMKSVARGNVIGTTSCRGTTYNGGGEIGVDVAAARAVDFADDFEGGDPSFASYCGAGAQSGDPFPPIARALAVPEPGSIGLVAVALAALGGIARRRRIGTAA